MGFCKICFNDVLVNTNPPNNRWGKALLVACYVRNRAIFNKIKVDPYEIWKRRKPNISYSKISLCLAYYKAHT